MNFTNSSIEPVYLIKVSPDRGYDKQVMLEKPVHSWAIGDWVTVKNYGSYKIVNIIIDAYIDYFVCHLSQ